MKSLRLLTMLATLMLLGCTSVDRSNNLALGMTRDQVIAAMGKPPSATHATADGTTILEFDYAGTDYHPATGKVIGRRYRFPVYLRDGKTIAWGDVPPPK